MTAASFYETYAGRLFQNSDGCWLWLGARTQAGYGFVRVGRDQTYTHRLAWERMVGPIPEGLEVDHLCRNRACCNVDHLEPVTHAENMRRGYWGMKTHCPKGHAYTEANTIINSVNGGRQCRECKNARRRPTGQVRSKTVCQRGHEKTPENWNAKTSQCRPCARERKAERKARLEVAS